MAPGSADDEEGHARRATVGGPARRATNTHSSPGRSGASRTSSTAKPARVSADVKEVLQRDLELELGGIADLREGIATCEREGDAVSRELMVQILTDEEHHEDHLTTQLDLIEKIGIENYLVAQLSEQAAAGATEA